MGDLILGLDPGSRRTGFGIIAVGGDGSTLTHVAHGVIRMKDEWPMAERLRVLFGDLEELFAQYRPPCTVVEKIFFGKNADSAFKLGHARGVCVLAAARHAVLNGQPVQTGEAPEPAGAIHH